MDKKKKNEELQTRRDFFKKAAKAALPVIGAIVLATAPTIVKAQKTPMGCIYGCASSCSGSCSGGCMGCTGTCTGGCEGLCGGNCLASCSGTCSGSCTGTCSGYCSRGAVY